MMFLLAAAAGFALLGVGALALAVWTLTDAREQRRESLRMVERVQRAADTRQAELLDRIGHLIDKPWVLPPSAVNGAMPPVRDDDEGELLEAAPDAFHSLTEGYLP
jgi:hypothetical protein